MKFSALLTLLTLPAFGEFRQQVTATGTTLQYLKNDRLVTEYRTDSHFPYLYPLIAPSGQSMTRHFPMKKDVAGEQHDHPHHRSFWFTHGDVNGHDFWHSKDGKSKIVHQSFASTEEDTFSVNLEWQHDGSTLLKELRTYRFSSPSDQGLLIEVTSVLTAVTDVTFGDTKEGSFALRVCPTLRVDGKVAKGSIINSQKQTNKDAWGQRARWVCYLGPDPGGNPSAVAMMDHPQNHNHPTRWHARTYGLLTANPFGEKSFTKKGDGTHTLEQGKSLTQKYAVLLNSKTTTPDEVEKIYQSFIKS